MNICIIYHPKKKSLKLAGMRNVAFCHYANACAEINSSTGLRPALACVSIQIARTPTAALPCVSMQIASDPTTVPA